jgi:tetratricopeptide (TPR) repeat protein
MYYILDKRNQQALQHFLNAVELDPNFLEAKYNLAYLNQIQKEFKKAKALYKEILEVNAKEIKSLNNLAWIYIEEGRNTDAKELLEKCLQIDPEFELAKENLKRINEL